MLRRILVAALLAAATISITPASAVVPHSSWRWDTCRFRNLHAADDGFSRREIILTIRCAVWHFPVIGGPTRAVDVADCESGLNPYAVNPNGHYGLYQDSPGLWAGLLAQSSVLVRHWNLSRNVFNARSNAVLNVEYAHGNGWGAWAACA